MIEIVIWCSILAIIVFGIQFVLCNKANRKIVKCIPVYIIIGNRFLSSILPAIST